MGAAGDESVLSGFAGRSSTSQCALQVNSVSCPLTPILPCLVIMELGSLFIQKRGSRVLCWTWIQETAHLQFSKAVFPPAVALSFALTEWRWELFPSIYAGCLKKLGLKRQAAVLIMLISEVPSSGGRNKPNLTKPSCLDVLSQQSEKAAGLFFAFRSLSNAGLQRHCTWNN